jgi:hypothetical protein
MSRKSEQKKEKYHNNESFRIIDITARVIRRYVYEDYMSSLNPYLPYDPDELKMHLEKRYKYEYGEDFDWSKIKDFNIDHAISSDSFNIQEFGDDMFNACWDLENLKFEPISVNKSKRNSFAEPTEKQLQDPIIQKILNEKYFYEDGKWKRKNGK